MNNDKLLEQVLVELMTLRQEITTLTKENVLLREQVVEINQTIKDSFFYVV